MSYRFQDVYLKYINSNNISSIFNKIAFINLRTEISYSFTQTSKSEHNPRGTVSNRSVNLKLAHNASTEGELPLGLTRG